MAIETLYEFAKKDTLTKLLVKERVKCLRKNRHDNNRVLDKDCELESLSNRKMLSRIMPPRFFWVRPKKRPKQKNGATDNKKLAEKQILLTIKRDRKRASEGTEFCYLKELDAYIDKIKARLLSDDFCLQKPKLMPILKDQVKRGDGTFEVTCRPLTYYDQLEDKIILALTSKYLTKYFDRYLHQNILSYRPARLFNGFRHTTDFNDGIKLIEEYRKTHVNCDIYVADCDIKKFYDIIHHQVVRDCIRRLLDKSILSSEGKAQVMKVTEAYLKSYNFYDNVWMEAKNNEHIFYKVKKRLHDKDGKNTYLIKWADEILQQKEIPYQQFGVSQGGALSLLIANIVLNDVDQAIIGEQDDDRLFIRFCDDMILMHTDYDKCCELMDKYAESLRQHRLYYHEFKNVDQLENRREFWNIKSHRPFLWAEGEGNANFYVGFLGYEMARDGYLRLRKSNVQRFKEKFLRNRYANRRYLKNDKNNDFEQHQEEVLDRTLKGLDFYAALDLKEFMKSRQYCNLKLFRKKVEIRPPINHLM